MTNVKSGALCLLIMAVCAARLMAASFYEQQLERQSQLISEQRAPFINSWLLCGPFEAPVAAEEISPELGAELGGMKWEFFDDRLWNRNYDNYQDLSGYYHIRKGIDTRNRYVYAAAEIYSDSEQAAELRFGTSGIHKVYLNGEEIHAVSEPREVQRDMHSVAVELRSGWNSLLMEIYHSYTRDENENGAYVAKDAAVSYLGLYARVSDSDGRALPGLLYSTRGDAPELEILTQPLAADDVAADEALRGRGLPDNELPIGYREWPYVWNTTLYDLDNRRIWADHYRFQAAGGVPEYHWSVVEGSLPDGLSLSSDGRILGVCRAVGAYDFTLQVKDDAGAEARREMSIRVKERPTRWFELGRVGALTHCEPVYPFWVDPHYSADAWAERAQRQGHALVCLETLQQNYYWPSKFEDPHHPRNLYQPRDEQGRVLDGISPFAEALRRYDIRLGLYLATEGGGLGHYSTDVFVQHCDELLRRYDPDYFYFDGPQTMPGANYDVMFSNVRNYGDDIIINSNVWSDHGEYGDADLGTSEASHIYSPAHPARFNKRVIIEPWKSVHTKNNYTPYYAKRDDFRQVLKEMFMNVGRGLVDNIDQMPLMSRGPNYDPPSEVAERYPKSVQEFIDVREAHAAWCAPTDAPNRLEAISGTEPYFLEGWGYEQDGDGNIADFAAGKGPDWGYAVARDNNIYLNMLAGPDGKVGYRGEESIEIGPVSNRVVEVSWLNQDQALSFEQKGDRLSIDLRPVVADPVCTIIRITIDKSAREFRLSDLQLRSEQLTPATLRIVPRPHAVYPALQIALADTQLTFSSSAPEVARVDAEGVVRAVAPGRAIIAVAATSDGAAARESIELLVDSEGRLRVAEELVGVRLRLDGKEAYLKLASGEEADWIIEGRSNEGGSVALNGAAVELKFGLVDYKKATHHHPVFIQEYPAFEVGDGTLRAGPVAELRRAAVWAEVELDGRSFTSNRIYVDIEPHSRIEPSGIAAGSSGHVEGYAPELVLDGVLLDAGGSDRSKWSARVEDSPWLQFDFGRARPVSEIRIHWNTYEQRYHNTPAAMEIQASDDGVQWRTLRTVSPPASGTNAYFGFADAYTFKAVETRYLRLFFPGGAQAAGNVDVLEAALYHNPLYNLAMEADISASSIFVGGEEYDYSPGNVADGVIGEHARGEWGSADEADPWIRLDWDEAVLVNKIILHDRANPNDHLRQGVLYFSDGSQIAVEGIPNDGSGKVIEFPPRLVEWIKFEGRGNAAGNNGFSEIVVPQREFDAEEFQSWAESYGLQGELAAPAADPARSGMNNLLKWRFGFDPTDPGSSLRISVRIRDERAEITVNRVISEGLFSLKSRHSIIEDWRVRKEFRAARREDDYRITLPLLADTRAFFKLNYSL